MKESISKGQAISVLLLYLIGTSLFMGSSGTSQSDNWIAILIGLIFALPVVFMYARLHVLYPGKDLFEMLFDAFGPYLGRGVALLYIWYAFHLGSLVLRNFGEFVKSVAIPETPMIIPMMMVGLLCIWVIYEGIEVLGRAALVIIFGLMVVYVFAQGLGISALRLHYLLPILENGWNPVIRSGFSAFSFPFAESVLFLSVVSFLKKDSSSYKIMLGSLSLACLVMVITSLRNTAVLGVDVVSTLYYPTYVAVSRISIGNFLQRIEGSVSVVFVSALFVKVSICLYSASIGISRLFRLSSYRSIVIQIGLLMIYLSSFVYSSMMEMADWAYEVYQYYAFPFQVIIPLLLFLIGEYRNRKSRAAPNPPTAQPT